MADSQKVVTTSRSWKAECDAADKTKEDKTAYQFSNGKKFVVPEKPRG